MNNRVRTSVIIPIYNTERYLRECINSVVSQADQGIEVILVDDGSVDGSKKIIEEYSGKYSFVKSIYQKNQKQGAARNAGVEKASGKYIYFLDSDDYISVNLFKMCYQIAEENKLDFLMFDAVAFLDEDKGKNKSKTFDTYSRKGIGIEDKVYSGIEFWNKYFPLKGVYSNVYLTYINADFLRKNNLSFEEGIYYEDNDWMLRMYLCAERIAYIPYQLYYRRYRAGSTTTAVYNEVHLRSSIIECKKILQMLFEESNEYKQKMVFDKIKNMLRYFKNIFAGYCENYKLEYMQTEILSFYKYLLSIYAKIIIQYKYLRIAEITAVIEKKLRQSNIPMNKIEADFEIYKKQELSKILQNYPLQDKNMKIGIYGTGQVCEDFLRVYGRYVGDLNAKVFFIDTFKRNEKNYKGYPLYNVKDINKISIDIIIIASICYKEEMLENIKMTFSEEVTTLYVPEFLLNHLHYFI